MTDPEPKHTLVDYLQNAREAMLFKLEGLGEYDVRRPLTPTGTTLLGLVKHLASVELGYFGDTFGRPSGIDLPWHAAVTFEQLDLDATGEVPWWPAEHRAVNLHQILVHLVAETSADRFR